MRSTSIRRLNGCRAINGLPACGTALYGQVRTSRARLVGRWELREAAQEVELIGSLMTEPWISYSPTSSAEEITHLSAPAAVHCADESPAMRRQTFWTNGLPTAEGPAGSAPRDSEGPTK